MYWVHCPCEAMNCPECHLDCKLPLDRLTRDKIFFTNSFPTTVLLNSQPMCHWGLVSSPAIGTATGLHSPGSPSTLPPSSVSRCTLSTECREHAIWQVSAWASLWCIAVKPLQTRGKRSETETRNHGPKWCQQITSEFTFLLVLNLAGKVAALCLTGQIANLKSGKKGEASL